MREGSVGGEAGASGEDNTVESQDLKQAKSEIDGSYWFGDSMTLSGFHILHIDMSKCGLQLPVMLNYTSVYLILELIDLSVGVAQFQIL